MKVKVKDCTVELVIGIWDDEVEVKDIEHVIEEAIENVGYALSSGPKVVMVREREEEV